MLVQRVPAEFCNIMGKCVGYKDSLRIQHHKVSHSNCRSPRLFHKSSHCQSPIKQDYCTHTSDLIFRLCTNTRNTPSENKQRRR